MISREILKQVMLDQRSLQGDMSVSREGLVQVKTWASNDLIVIITGIRRCGKSTLVKQLRELIHEQDFTLNFEDERLISFQVEDFQTLLELFIEQFGDQKTVYFDEIQNVIGWERFVRRLHEYGYKIYITGSNAHLLSKELGTHLTGRYLSFALYPYSFREYLQASHHPITDINAMTTIERSLYKKYFNEYINQGGLPGYLKNNDPEYLAMIYENIIYRDIISRYNIPNEKPIKELALFLASNISKLITFSSLRKMLGLASGTTVSQYCQYLENCYLFFFINRYDDSLKRQLLAPKKCYIIDSAIANVIGFRNSSDTGRFLENIVFLELKRRYQDQIYQIYYHKDKNECDFILRKARTIFQAIQVCLHLDNEQTKKREYAGLLEAMETYGLDSGLILTENQSFEENVPLNNKIVQIKVQPIWEWLLGTNYR
jgi:predicted AAA+ superfamily ATPase